ncbi:MAG: autotransporter domain-containing protein [Pseudomonadota bacterium]
MPNTPSRPNTGAARSQVATARRRAWLGTTALVGLLALALDIGPALAGSIGGGNGSWLDGTPGQPGTGGAPGQGGAGANGDAPGGAGGALGGSSSIGVTNTATISGGAGGAGSTPSSTGTGGGGGGGGDGWGISAGTLTNTGRIYGGNGGTGGTGIYDPTNPGKGINTGSGSGGGGGAAIVGFGGTINNSGVIYGGSGGNGGITYDAGSGGGGGAGIFGSGMTIVNSSGGLISGGNGGAGSSNALHGNFGGAGSGGAAGGVGGVSTPGSYLQNSAGAGGAAIIGSNLSVVNAGVIQAGLYGTGNGGATANAITFTGGYNSLELWGSGGITGNVVDQTGSGAFRLGGSANGTFDVSALGVQYQGFSTFQKVGNGIWTLTGVQTGTTLWQISQGTLAISQDASLGSLSAIVKLDGGLLETTASFTMNHLVGISASGGVIKTDPGTTLTLANGIADYGGGGLTKAGAGTLNIASFTFYTGSTTINDGGILALTGVGSIARSSSVTVNSGTFDISGTTAGASIQALSGAAALGSVVLGSQTLTVTNAIGAPYVFNGSITGTGGLVVSRGAESLFGHNTYSGGTTIGSAGYIAVSQSSADSTYSLGSGTVNVQAGGRLQAVTSGAFTFKNNLTGSGQLTGFNSGQAFAFDAAAGTAFAGTVVLGSNTFALSGVNTAALTNATLSLSTGNVTTVGAGTQAIGGLAISGGTVVFDATAPSRTSANSLISTGSLDVSSTGAIRVNIPGTYVLPASTPPGNLSLFQQSHANAGLKLVSASGAVTGSGGALTLQDQNGNAISAGRSVNLQQNGQTVAVASYNYNLTTGMNRDGLYVGYGLTQLALQGGQQLVLTEDAGAVGANADLAASLTGTGNLVVAANNLVSLSNPGNSFTGTTLVQSGTLQAGAANVIASSSAVDIESRFDTNGFNQSLTNLTGGRNGQIILSNGNTLTLNGSAQNTFAGVISGAGTLTQASGTQVLTGANTYSGGTNVTGGTLVVGNNRALGTGTVTMTQGTTLDFQGNRVVANAFTLTGISDFNVNGGLTTILTGSISDGTSPGGLIKSGAGTLILTGLHSYTGGTTISGGRLQVDGSIASSSNVTVGSGAILSGIGLVDPPAVTTIASGGTLSPGNATNPVGMLTITGNLAFQSGASYVVSLYGTQSSSTYDTGQTTPGGATVTASFIGGSTIAKRYTILTADGGVSGTFNGTVNATLPTNFKSSLTYDPTHAYLTLALDYGSGLTRNQQAVGGALSSYFDRNGSIPLAFGMMSPAALSQVSGELATGTQQTTFNAMNLFMGTMTDRSAAGRGQGGCGAADLPAKAPRGTGCAQPWSVWVSGFGGSQTTDGNALTGSSAATGSVYGTAVGADYRISQNTVAGFALGGGGTNFSVKGMGAGRSDLFQAGAYVRHDNGPAYVTAAVATGWQDVTMDRTVAITGVDRLHAAFNALAYSGRVESGYRFVAPVAGGVGLTPYAAAQVTAFDLPGYAESVTAGAGTFALAYAGKTATDTRSELGLRADKAFALQDGLLNLRGRLAWVHDFNPDRALTASFQTLPGASFVVNGAAQASDAALVTASVEKVWLNGWSAAATFEGEFSNVTRSYAGKGVVRYGW